MATNSSILSAEQAKIWLRQFALGDQRDAAELLKSFVLVSSNEFSNGLRTLALLKSADVQGPIGLFAERELRQRFGSPHRLFKQQSGKIRRATGLGPEPVKSTKRYDASVGSEGLVAQLITELCREQPKKFLNHPGPDKIRKTRTRRLWVLTDFIGTGARASKYLTAAWKVNSVRSWWSGGFIRLGVLAYASTARGERCLHRHPSKPDVWFLKPCPTIDNSFPAEKSNRFKRLCQDYDPLKKEPREFPWFAESLGYQNTGALIAFAHGAPNNSPRIFHKAAPGRRGRPSWTPLFPARVTAGLPPESFGASLSSEDIAARLDRLGQSVLAKSPAAMNATIATKKRFLILAALARGRPLDDVLALRSGLNKLEVAATCDELFELGWIDSRKRMTDSGYAELRHAKRKFTDRAADNKLGVDDLVTRPYYPTSLRSPISKSS